MTIKQNIKSAIIAIVFLIANKQETKAASYAIQASTLESAIHSVATAKKGIVLSAFILSNNGQMTRTLEAAAERNVPVVIVLPAHPFDPSGIVSQTDGKTAERLAKAGARIVATPFDLHLKSLIVDEKMYLTDENWTEEGLVVTDSIIEDQKAVGAALHGNAEETTLLATQKAAALIREQTVIGYGDADIETESFGYGQIWSLIERNALNGRRMRLLVTQREYTTDSYERAAIERLRKDGAQVRVTQASGKSASGGGACWFGSTNATDGLPEQVDWGIYEEGPICRTIAQRFQERWQKAQ